MRMSVPDPTSARAKGRNPGRLVAEPCARAPDHHEPRSDRNARNPSLRLRSAVMGAYDPQRAFWVTYRNALLADKPLRDEMTGALKELHRRYNSTVWENRFVCGGVAEQVIGSSARALGLTVANAGKTNQGYDLELAPGVGISVKAEFAVNSSVTLVNTRGDAADRTWDYATIFVLSSRGVGYADPELVPDATSRTKDQINIKVKPLLAYWDANPTWFIGNMEIPPKSDTPSARVASDAISWDILQDFPRLVAHFKPEV